MKIMGFVKRFIPFLAAFAVGVFITSFFVDLSRPRFNFRGHGWERHRMYEQMRVENEQLKNEIFELKQGHRCDADSQELPPFEAPQFPTVKDIPNSVTQPVPPVAAPAPPAPRAHR